MRARIFCPALIESNAKVSRKQGAIACGLVIAAATAFVAPSAHATVCAFTINGSLDDSDPLLNSQLAGATSPSVCGSPKDFPGLADGNQHVYDIYSFTNPGTSPACFTFNLTWPGANAMYAAAYDAGAFDPTAPLSSTGYLGDQGVVTTTSTTSWSITIQPGESFDLLVYAVGTGAFTSGSYSVAVSTTDITDATGCVNPTISASTSVTPSAFGQPVTFSASASGFAGAPTGTIEFDDGATSIGSDSLDVSGHMSFTISTLAVGPHAIVATYQGDSIYVATASDAVSQQCNQAATSTTLSSSQSPLMAGDTVTLTATVAVNAPGAGSPTGQVTFYDGPDVLGMGTVANGQATFATSALSIGDHVITAVYGGDASFAGSTSAPLTQTIQMAGATVMLASSEQPSTFGDSVQFTATVSGTGTPVTPTGTVTFTDGTNPLGTPVTLDAGGVAALITAALGGGVHTITAQYSGDATFNSASSSVSQTVNPAPSATAVVLAPASSVFGQPVAATATVTSAAGVPDGTVTFSEGTSMLATVAVGASGTAPLNLSSLAVGQHTITAQYSGSANFAAGNPVGAGETVGKSSSATGLSTSSTPVTPGTQVTFTATIAATAPGRGTPTGNVTFRDGTTIIGVLLLANGSAALATSSLAVGTHSITASYAGDDSFNGSASGTVNEMVTQAAATATLVPSPGNQSSYGQNVTFTGTISASAGGTPSGQVAFKDGNTALGSATLNPNGVATLVVHTLSAGTHTVAAVYSGDVNHPGGATATVTQNVSAAGTNITLGSSPRPSTVGRAVVLTATVSGGALPTDLVAIDGTVTFKDGPTVIGTGSASNGTATLTISTLLLGAHALSANYGGAANYNGSSSAPLIQEVNAAPPVDGGPGDTGPPDAGAGPPDAGAAPDANAPDASMPADASQPGDSGAAVDTGHPTTSGGGGCGCYVAGEPARGATCLLVAGAMMLFAARRRRSSTRH
jgi:hypothetical protein